MKRNNSLKILVILVAAALCIPINLLVTDSFAQPVPGGTLDPLIIPKYTQPLIIPPEMPAAGEVRAKGTNGQKIPYYEIEVVEFEQQVLPPKDVNNNTLPMTKVWSYGALGQPGTRNYPAFTVEAKVNRPTRVKWINNLVDANGNHLPHLLTNTVDQTVHWANPVGDCADPMKTRDCKGTSQMPYDGPVPIITHVHGAHVGPESDGYPEAWWLPAANDVICMEDDPVNGTHWCKGTLYDQYDPGNTEPGSAVFQYPNTQRETTLWYHDHTLGMTRLNVYAGPAGFWLIRGGTQEDMLNLPGPAPRAKDKPGRKYYEIPIVIQDRSFNADGSLFYPIDREFFEGLLNDPVNDELNIDFAPDSDVLPIWNPEAFFNTMVVNGRTWPYLDVDQGLYRFRLLNGCNSRFLNLSLQIVSSPDPALIGTEVPFYHIGAEGGLLPQVVRIQTGEATLLPGNGSMPPAVPASDPAQALLMALAERADVLVDFTGLPAGTRVRMLNTAPDAPFGGFGDPPADPGTSGQVMEFVVGMNSGPLFTAPQDLVLAPRTDLVPGNLANPRRVSLNEEESQTVCVLADAVTEEFLVPINQVACNAVPPAGAIVVPFGPTAALLGTYDSSTGMTTPLIWMDAITENPALGSTEQWEIWNFTMDAHPIHLHLVQFQVVNREDQLTGMVRLPEPWEAGWKDTVISYPGEITRINAMFDIAGLYVWHCHIVEHEDNEMMRPYYVGNPCLDPNVARNPDVLDANGNPIICP